MNHTYTGMTYANNGVRVAFCHSCGFHHQVELPTQQYLDDYYAKDDFYKLHAPRNWFEREKKEHEVGLWTPYYKYKLSLLERSPTQRKFLVDVGCGSGWFVQYVHQQPYWYAFGCEPSADARSVLDLPLVFDKESLIPYYTDVHMALVLEHVLNPKEMLQHWIEKLPVGGRVMVIVPNEFSSLQRRLKTLHFISPVHINYFCGETLRNLMQSIGLRVIHESATAPLELFQILGIKYIGNDALGHRCHNIRLQFEKMFGVHAFNLYRKLYEKWGWGREIIMVGERV